MDAKELGQIVKDVRKRQGLTQSYLAALSKTGLRFISDLENGKRTIQLEKAFAVCRVLGLQVQVVAKNE